MMQKRWGFTLAEVLLTMTIVGVVAAMTIPTLNYNRVKKEYSAKLRNFYSRMDNAVLEMQTEKGSFRDFLNYTHEDNVGRYDANRNFDWYMEYLDPYMGHKYVDEANRRVYFQDGSSLTIQKGGCMDVHYDVNGDKAPNRGGYDRFIFLFCFSDGRLKADGNCDMDPARSMGGRCYWFGSKDIFFGTYGGGLARQDVDREYMINKCRNEVAWCTRLLQNDQWEFKDDYPIRF